MLLRAARHLWAQQHDPFATDTAVDHPQRRWDEMEAALGDLDLSDPLFAKIVHKWRNDLHRGLPVRKMRDPDRKEIRGGKLIASSVNLYIGDLITYISHVSKVRNEGDEPIFKGTPPRLFKLKRDTRKEPRRWSVDATLTDEQVADLKLLTQREREASDTPDRLSVDERILWLGLHAGGQRISRINAMLWNPNIDLKKRKIDFRTIAGLKNSPNKMGHPEVPIDDELLAFLKKAWAQRTSNFFLDRAWPKTYAQQRVRRMFELIGLPAGGPHLFRKTVASKAGDDAHLAIGTTYETAQKHYAKPNTQRVQAAFAKVTYDAPVDPDKVLDLPATRAKDGRPGKGQ